MQPISNFSAFEFFKHKITANRGLFEHFEMN
jgi:hypothetical protein